MTPKLKTASIFAAVALTAALLAGCVAMTPEQQARIDNIVSQVTALKADLSTLGAAGAELARLIDETAAKVKAGQLPVAEGEKLLALYSARRDAVKAAIENVQLKLSAANAERKALEAEGVPLWRVLLETGIGLALGYAGVRYRVQLGKTQTVAEGLSAVVETVKSKGYSDGLTAKTLAEYEADPALSAAIRRSAQLP